MLVVQWNLLSHSGFVCAGIGWYDVNVRVPKSTSSVIIVFHLAFRHFLFVVVGIFTKQLSEESVYIERIHFFRQLERTSA